MNIIIFFIIIDIYKIETKFNFHINIYKIYKVVL